MSEQIEEKIGLKVHKVDSIVSAKTNEKCVEDIAKKCSKSPKVGSDHE